MASSNSLIHAGKLFEYDFSACAYNLIRNAGVAPDGLDITNKLQRNKEIGKMQGESLHLSRFLHRTMRDLVEGYCFVNGIDKNNIVLTQPDGAILSQKLDDISMSQGISEIGELKLLIFSVDRRKWLKIYSDLRVTYHGITQNLYNPSFFGLFDLLDTSSTDRMISSASHIRSAILNGTEKTWYLLNIDGNIVVPIADGGMMNINESGLLGIRIEDIDRHYIWTNYCWWFAQSILVESSLNRRF